MIDIFGPTYNIITTIPIVVISLESALIFRDSMETQKMPSNVEFNIASHILHKQKWC